MEYSRPRGSTKEKIFLAAAELFAQRSYAAVSVREIADKVYIRAASIHNHYHSKEEILEELYERGIIRHNENVQSYADLLSRLSQSY